MEQASGAILAAVIIGAVSFLVYVGKKLVLRYRWKEHEILIAFGNSVPPKCVSPNKGSTDSKS